MDQGRVIGICIGFLLAIPAVFIRLILRFITLGCGVFSVKSRTQPACLLDPELGVHKYMRVNGVKIHYVEAGDADKPLLLFVHGFPEFWFSWRHQIKHFQKNYRVVAMDTRGYNQSEKPPGIEEYHLKNLIDDIKCLVEGIGVQKFTLVAHDFGGAIAWCMAAVYPEMIEKMIICNSPHTLVLEDAKKNSWAQKLMSWYTFFFQFPILPELFWLMEDLSIVESNLIDAKETETEVFDAYKYAFRDFKTWNRVINYYRADFTDSSIEFNKKIRDKMSCISVPTLHIFGTGDKYLGLDTAQASSNYVKNYQLDLLDGVSHWSIEEAPGLVNKHIEKFLQQD